MTNKALMIEKMPEKWERKGLILSRGAQGEMDSDVTGDPCIVVDEENQCYQMFYFAQKKVDGKEVNSNARATAPLDSNFEYGAWTKQGSLIYKNPEDLVGDTHKPWILMDAYHINQPVKINGLYYLFTVSIDGDKKVVQMATAPSLDSGWHVIKKPVIENGVVGSFDELHADAVTAYWFEDKKEVLMFYMAYPYEQQPETPHSPYASRSAAARLNLETMKTEKLGNVLLPAVQKGSWTHGYIGGFQIMKATKGWYAILGGSPTPPVPVAEEPEIREAKPSLGGFAYTEEEWPISGWKAFEEPFEWIENIPESALKAGEGVNLWRHHMVIKQDGSMFVCYNTGNYGQEQMFMKKAVLE